MHTIQCGAEHIHPLSFQRVKINLLSLRGLLASQWKLRLGRQSSRCCGVETGEDWRPVRICVQREEWDSPRCNGQQDGKDPDHVNTKPSLHLQSQSHTEVNNNLGLRGQSVVQGSFGMWPRGSESPTTNPVVQHGYSDRAQPLKAVLDCPDPCPPRAWADLWICFGAL